MKLHEVKAPKRRPARRVGRGISAGQGKTAGRGTKGQTARTGFKLPRRFEGGQSPLILRMPKQVGFRSVAIKPVSVRIDKVLDLISDEKVTIKNLFEAGLIKADEARTGLVKLVGNAEKLRPLKFGKGVTATKKLWAKLNPGK